jgi:hypothetical protein
MILGYYSGSRRIVKSGGCLDRIQPVLLGEFGLDLTIQAEQVE